MEVRGRAIGMIEAGMKIKMVAEAVGLSLRTLEYWCRDCLRIFSVKWGRTLGGATGGVVLRL